MSCLSTYKILVAYAEDSVLQSLLDNPDWPAAIDKITYVDQLQEIRNIGFATSYEEREPGAAAVSAPIFGRSGKIAAALSVSGPVSRLSPLTLQEFGPILIEAAKDIGMMINS